MPQIPLTSYSPGQPMPVVEPTGQRLLIPRLQFRVLVRLPGAFFPRDGIIDTGSPFTWFPEAIWNQFRPGVDFEELPFEAGYIAPRGQTAGWTFTFRMVRMLRPVVLFDLHTRTELTRDRLVVQFANGNPPSNKSLPRIVLGLWGGVLEGTNLRLALDPRTGHTIGTIDW